MLLIPSTRKHYTSIKKSLISEQIACQKDTENMILLLVGRDAVSAVTLPVLESQTNSFDKKAINGDKILSALFFFFSFRQS